MVQHDGQKMVTQAAHCRIGRALFRRSVRTVAHACVGLALALRCPLSLFYGHTSWLYFPNVRPASSVGDDLGRVQ